MRGRSKPHEAIADVDEGRHRALDLEQVALEIVDALHGRAVEGLVEDLVLQALELGLQRVHHREVVVDHEVHDGVEDGAGALGEEAGGALAAGPHRRVTRGGAVAHGHYVLWPHEDMRLAQHHLLLLLRPHRGAEHHEDRIAVLLDLRPLMRKPRVLDGKIVKTELLLDLLEELGRGIEETDPHEDVGLLQDLADVRDGHVTDAPPTGVGGGGDDTRRGRLARGRRHHRRGRRGPRRTDATSPARPSA